MKNKILAALLVFLNLLLGGCATQHKVGYGLDNLEPGQIPPDSGIVLISTGAPKSCVSTSTFLSIRSATAQDTVGPFLSVDGWTMKSDFEDHVGKAYAYVLPAGDYFITPFIANPYVHLYHLPRADFSVAAGEVVYLGEYFLPVSCSISNVSEIRDQRERDIALLSQRHPGLANANILTRLPPLSEYDCSRYPCVQHKRLDVESSSKPSH
jgi:hypothetical protein